MSTQPEDAGSLDSVERSADSPETSSSPTEAEGSSSVSADHASPAASASPAVSDGSEAPRKRRRRRRRGKSKKPDEQVPPQAQASPAPATPAAPADPTLAALAGGLLSHIDDREVPCSADGCINTWVWTAAEQIKAYGQPPPRRMCAACQALADQELRCAVDGCARTWTWTRDAQLKHRSWLKRQTDSGSVGRNRKGRRRKGRVDGPPRRKCELCQTKLGLLTEREGTCKVHGCTRSVTIDKDAQLRAWAALHTDDLQAEAPLPKKMCDVCREFCRLHSDREVPCGRPGCDRTWTYKTGAQLQAFLAGRLEDPIRLCETCTKGNFTVEEAYDLPEVETDLEIMPCIVPGCDGRWIYRVGMSVAPASDGELVVDRMCDVHRVERGEPPRAEASTDVDDPSRTSSSPVSDPDSGDESASTSGTAPSTGASVTGSDGSDALDPSAKMDPASSSNSTSPSSVDEPNDSASTNETGIETSTSTSLGS